MECDVSTLCSVLHMVKSNSANWRPLRLFIYSVFISSVPEIYFLLRSRRLSMRFPTTHSRSKWEKTSGTSPRGISWATAVSESSEETSKQMFQTARGMQGRKVCPINTSLTLSWLHSNSKPQKGLNYAACKNFLLASNLQSRVQGMSFQRMHHFEHVTRYCSR